MNINPTCLWGWSNSGKQRGRGTFALHLYTPSMTPTACSDCSGSQTTWKPVGNNICRSLCRLSVFMERETSWWPGNTLTQLAASPTDQMEVKTFTTVTETYHNAPFMMLSPVPFGCWWWGVFFQKMEARGSNECSEKLTYLITFFDGLTEASFMT